MGNDMLEATGTLIQYSTHESIYGGYGCLQIEPESGAENGGTFMASSDKVRAACENLPAPGSKVKVKFGRRFDKQSGEEKWPRLIWVETLDGTVATQSQNFKAQTGGGKPTQTGGNETRRKNIICVAGNILEVMKPITGDDIVRAAARVKQAYVHAQQMVDNEEVLGAKQEKPSDPPAAEAQLEEERQLASLIGFDPESKAWGKYKKENFEGHDTEAGMTTVIAFLNDVQSGAVKFEGIEADGVMAFSS